MRLLSGGASAPHARVPTARVRASERGASTVQGRASLPVAPVAQSGWHKSSSDDGVRAEGDLRFPIRNWGEGMFTLSAIRVAVPVAMSPKARTPLARPTGSLPAHRGALVRFPS